MLSLETGGEEVSDAFFFLSAPLCLGIELYSLCLLAFLISKNQCFLEAGGEEVSDDFFFFRLGATLSAPLCLGIHLYSFGLLASLKSPHCMDLACWPL